MRTDKAVSSLFLTFFKAVNEIMGRSEKKQGRYIANRLTKAIPRRLTSVFLSIAALLSVIFLTDPALVQNAWSASKVYRLVIEDFHSGKMLWQSIVKADDEILYLHNHSVYGVEILHKYMVDHKGDFVLVSVRSLPFVLFDPYPGYSLPYQEKKKNHKGMIEVKINRRKNKIIMAVGDKLTRKRFIIGNRVISLQNINSDVSVVRLMLKKLEENNT